MSKEEKNIFMFLAGMFSGVLTGVILGLLLAPRSGKEIREDLNDKFSELKSVGADRAIKVANTVQHKASRISSKLDELARRSSDVLIQDEIQ